MADARASILLQVNSNLAGIRETINGFAAAQQAARRTSDEIKRSQDSLRNYGTDFGKTMLSAAGIGASFASGATAAMSVIRAVQGITNQLKEAVNEGVRFNATIETTGFGLAGALKQFGGEKFKNFSDAMTASAQVVELLKTKALDLGLSFPELADQYRSTVGAMFKGGITDLNKQVELTVTLMRSMDSLGIHGFQAVRDVADILNGVSNRTMAGRMLQIEDADLKAASDAGKLYEFLEEKLSGVSVAASAALNSTESLENRLKNTKANVAAEATKDLTESYKGLLRSVTELDQSSAYRRILATWANLKAVGQFFATESANSFSGNRGAAIGAVSRAKGDVSSFNQQASNVRSDDDVRRATAAGLALNSELTATAKLGSASSDTREKLLSMASAVLAEVQALEKEGAQRILNNKLLDEAARKEAAARTLAREAAKAREEGVKKFAEESEKAQTRLRATAKATDSTWYLGLLAQDRDALRAKLGSADASPSRYLSPADRKDPDKVKEAEKAASAFVFETSGKLLEVEKEISETIEQRAKKTKADADAREKAALRLLQVKASEGTLEEKITALNAEKAALDKKDLNFKADALTIDIKIAKLKDDEAALLLAEAARTTQRLKEAEIDRIRDNQFSTDRQKRAQLYNAFKREELGIGQRIAALQALVKSQDQGSATKAQAQTELDALLTRRDVGLPHDLTENKPQTTGQEIVAAMTQVQNGFRTIASSFADITASSIGDLSDGLDSLFWKTKSLKDATLEFGLALSHSATKALSDMVSQWIIQHAVMDNVRRFFHLEGTAQQAAATTAQVGIHAAGEVSKTGATTTGTVARKAITLGETIFHGIQVAIRTAAHIAGEVAKTATTVVQTGLRIAAVIAESLADVVKAAVGAASAMASIPYVGPFLAIAAMGAMFAAGGALVKGISKGFKKGGWTGDGSDDEVAGPAHKNEYIVPANVARDPRARQHIAMLEAMRSGQAGYKTGGWVGKLLTTGIDDKLVDYYRMFTGTKAQTSETTVAMDTRTPAQREMFVKSGASAVSAISPTSVDSSGSGGGIGGSQQRTTTEVNIGFFNTKQDFEQWTRTKTGEAYLIDWLRQRKEQIA